MKKLEEVRTIISKLKGDINKLTKHGFRKVYTDSASGRIFIHDGRGVVVKSPFLIKKKTPKFAVPTLIVKNPLSSYRDKKIFIQPKVIRARTRLAFVRLLDLGYRSTDHKAANCGWYRGKPVLIDW